MSQPDSALYKLSSKLKGKGHREFTAIEFLLLHFLADYDDKELQDCREKAAEEYLTLKQESTSKYKYGPYIINDWGGQGIYDATQVIGTRYAIIDEGGHLIEISEQEVSSYEHVYSRDIIPGQAVIVGDGEGPENFLFNDDVLEKVVELMNRSM
jgi:hypothetical protein